VRARGDRAFANWVTVLVTAPKRVPRRVAKEGAGGAGSDTVFNMGLDGEGSVGRKGVGRKGEEERSD